MENYYSDKSKRRSRLEDRNKFKKLRRSGISRKGDPIRSRCDDWKCIEFRKLKEVE
jgi:hypothetical protein